MLYLFKVRKLGAFNHNTGEWVLVYFKFVMSSQCFMHAPHKHKQREIAFFFYRVPDACAVFGCNTKVTQKTAEL